MSITDQLLEAVLLYGLPVLFGVILIASVGVPFPISLTLVAAGSFVRQGGMKLAPVIIAASIAAILGDQIGYGLSRWRGRSLIDRITRRLGGAAKIKRAEAVSKKWGGPGIFFSRWLVTALGPWLNFTSGMARYPWRLFIVWDAPGQVLWVLLYVTLGLCLQRPRAIHRGDTWQSRLGNSCSYCRDYPWLETNPIFSSQQFRGCLGHASERQTFRS